nr:methyl transferase [Talaromyces amestolkiae polymycovirus 1]
MFRRTGPRAAVQRPSPTMAQQPFSTSPATPSESGSSLSNLAFSSRSASVSSRGFRTPSGSSVTLPYTLFEFGFSAAPVTPLPGDAQFTDPRGEAFMASEAGTQLRRNERQYNAMLRQFIIRSVPLAGSDLLILGSGSSKEIIPLLNRGVARVTFVDINPRALARMQLNLHAAGVLSAVEAEYVCADAWEYLASFDSPSYDLVIATKCIGQILSTVPGRTVADFGAYVSPLLRPGGSLFCDHHMAFSSQYSAGTPIVNIVTGDLSDLATIAGRYASDVVYDLSPGLAEFATVATFSSVRSNHLVQSWQAFHFRLSIPPPPRVVRSSSYHPPLPDEIAFVPDHEPDPSVEALMPVNMKGSKWIPTAHDVAGHDITTMRLKFDGYPAILRLEGSTALLLSTVGSTAIPLNLSVDPPITLAAEVVPTGHSSAVVSAHGLLALGTTPSDPLDLAAFRSVAPTVSALAPSGIFPSLPELVRYVRGDALVLRGARGRDLAIPVDGVQLTIAGASGVFVKPVAYATADLDPATATDWLIASYDSLGTQFTSQPRAEGGTPGVITEFRRIRGTNTWRAGRIRNDKKKPDNRGAILHTILASHMAEELGLTSTVDAALKTLSK